MPSSILDIKIETCLQLTIGSSNSEKANDFKRKVKKVTNLTCSGFNETPLCKQTYDRLLSGSHINEILHALY